jgi:hypothetical protein
MALGTTYKQCGCRDGNGRRLGKKCPRLRRADGAWSRDHGSWYYQLELPAHSDGSRRTPLRRGGFASRAAAQQELNQARELLAIPLPGDQDGRRRIADLLGRSVSADGGLPDAATVRRLARAGAELAVAPLTGDWLEEWLAAARNLRPGTVRSYSSASPSGPHTATRNGSASYQRPSSTRDLGASPAGLSGHITYRPSCRRPATLPPSRSDATGHLIRQQISRHQRMQHQPSTWGSPTMSTSTSPS